MIGAACRAVPRTDLTSCQPANFAASLLQYNTVRRQMVRAHIIHAMMYCNHRSSGIRAFGGRKNIAPT